MRAAQYIRMSTEHQQYSIVNQSAVIGEYAKQHGFEIVRTYSDEARSGLDLAQRPGLRELLNDVIGGTHYFKAILVYDVSRWAASRTAMKARTTSFFASRAVLGSTTVPKISTTATASPRHC